MHIDWFVGEWDFTIDIPKMIKSFYCEKVQFRFGKFEQRVLRNVQYETSDILHEVHKKKRYFHIWHAYFLRIQSYPLKANSTEEVSKKWLLKEMLAIWINNWRYSKQFTFDGLNADMFRCQSLRRRTFSIHDQPR